VKAFDPVAAVTLIVTTSVIGYVLVCWRGDVEQAASSVELKSTRPR